MRSQRGIKKVDEDLGGPNEGGNCELMGDDVGGVWRKGGEGVNTGNRSRGGELMTSICVLHRDWVATTMGA